MWKELFACLTAMFIHFRTKCKCSGCCESECMFEEGTSPAPSPQTKTKKRQLPAIPEKAD